MSAIATIGAVALFMMLAATSLMRRDFLWTASQLK